MKNGAETTTCAVTTAVVVKGIRSPSASSVGPRRPLRPKVSSSAMPITAGGTTMGRSTSVSTMREPRPRRVAIHQARGVPARTTTHRLTRVVRALSHSAGAKRGWRAPAAMSPGEEAPASAISGTATMASMGRAARNGARSASERRYFTRRYCATAASVRKPCRDRIRRPSGEATNPDHRSAAAAFSAPATTPIR